MISDMCNAAGCVCVCVFQCTVVNETVCMCDFCLRAYFRYFSLQGIQMAGNHSTFSLISLSLSHQRQILSSLAHLSISQTSSSIICVNVFFPATCVRVRVSSPCFICIQYCASVLLLLLFFLLVLKHRYSVSRLYTIPLSRSGSMMNEPS